MIVRLLLTHVSGWEAHWFSSSLSTWVAPNWALILRRDLHSAKTSAPTLGVERGDLASPLPNNLPS